MIEVELKARVRDRAAVMAKVASFARAEGPIDKLDEYWHEPGWRERRDARGFRIRGEGGETVVTRKVKHREGGVESNRECEFAVSDRAYFVEFVRSLGCEPFYSKRKRGEAFAAVVGEEGVGRAEERTATIEVFEVPGIGDFIEIEILVPEGDPEAVALASRDVRALLARSDVSESDIEPRFYSELLEEAGLVSAPPPRERRRLDGAERARLSGSFVRLSRGFTHYELSGPVDGPVIVLVSGLSVPYSTWDRNAGSLAGAGYRVLRYDHYGRGYSDRPRARYDLELHVEQLLELVAALGLARPLALTGLSMGGPVAAAAAAREPGLARALVLVDPLYEWPARSSLARLLAAPGLGEVIMALRGRRILTEGQRGDFFDEAAYRAFIPTYLPPLAFRGIARAVLATMRSIPSWPLASTYEELGRAGIPTLLFWGREDATLPFAQGMRLRASLPRAEFRAVEGAGHVPQWEKAGEVNDAILDFLRRI